MISRGLSAWRRNVLCHHALWLACIAGLGAGCGATARPRPPAASSPASAGAGLAGSAWQFDEVRGIRVIEPGRTLLVLGRAARATGSTGCNSLMGEVTIHGSAIRFPALTYTKRGCDPPLMEQERAIAGALESVRAWVADGRERIALLDATGAPCLRLSRVAR